MTFAEDAPVWVKFPRDELEEQADRMTWPWLRGSVMSQVGPDEWKVIVQDPVLAEVRDGELWYPVCYRDASELMPAPCYARH